MTMYSNDDYMVKLGGDSLSEKDIIRLNTKYKCDVNITELVTMKNEEDAALNIDESSVDGGEEGERFFLINKYELFWLVEIF